MLSTGEYQARAAVLGEHMHARLAALPGDAVRAVRGRGLWAGVEFASLPGREVCERLATRGVLAKETHDKFTDSNLEDSRSDRQIVSGTIRLAPPLIISEQDLDWGLDQIEAVAREIAQA